jgi:hypothetical protein
MMVNISGGIGSGADFIAIMGDQRVSDFLTWKSPTVVKAILADAGQAASVAQAIW